MLCGVVACAHPTRIGLRGSEVMQHLEELGRNGYAELATVSITQARVQAANHENVFLDQTVTFRGATTSLAKLVEGCVPSTANTPCVLVAHADDLIVLRTLSPSSRSDAAASGAPGTPGAKDDRSQVGTVFGVLSLASFGGLTLCLILCESDKTEKSVALGSAGLVLGVIWAIASGGRD